MSDYAFVAEIQAVDPAEPEQWAITGDVYGVVSEDGARTWLVEEWARQKAADAAHLRVVCWSAFETTTV